LERLTDENFLEDKQKYWESRNIDDYLECKGQEAVTLLEQLRDECKPFYNQEITDAVVEFVRNNPEVLRGVRVGNIIYEIKIPYMTN
jgi:hypothetical protein